MALTSYPDDDLVALRDEVSHLRRVNQELLGTVAELRATIEKQQAHIERLVRMRFGRRSERVTGPTLFADLPDPDPPPPAPDRPAIGAGPTQRPRNKTGPVTAPSPNNPLVAGGVGKPRRLAGMGGGQFCDSLTRKRL